MTNKIKAIVGLAIAGGAIFLYSRLTPGEKEKFLKSFRKNGTNYLIQILSSGLSQALPSRSANKPRALSAEPLLEVKA